MIDASSQWNQTFVPLYLPIEKTKFLTQGTVFSSVHAKCEFCYKLTGLKNKWWIIRIRHAGQLIYEQNMDHESRLEEQVAV